MPVIPLNRSIYIETEIKVIECATCAIDFGIGADFQRRRREDHGNFYCPNGHPNVYKGSNKVDHARRRAERAEALASALRDQLDASERSRRATKAAHTRTKNRIAKGVCPCCKRSFVNVARHMAGQHPEYGVSDA